MTHMTKRVITFMTMNRIGPHIPIILPLLLSTSCPVVAPCWITFGPCVRTCCLRRNEDLLCAHICGVGTEPGQLRSGHLAGKALRGNRQ